MKASGYIVIHGDLTSLFTSFYILSTKMCPFETPLEIKLKQNTDTKTAKNKLGTTFYV